MLINSSKKIIHTHTHTPVSSVMNTALATFCHFFFQLQSANINWLQTHVTAWNHAAAPDLRPFQGCCTCKSLTMNFHPSLLWENERFMNNSFGCKSVSLNALFNATGVHLRVNQVIFMATLLDGNTLCRLGGALVISWHWTRAPK